LLQKIERGLKLTVHPPQRLHRAAAAAAAAAAVEGDAAVEINAQYRFHPTKTCAARRARWKEESDKK
jgi:hypothetical protein